MTVNDWVYCITPLSERKISVVTGSDLSLWQKIPQQNWEKEGTLLVEEKEVDQKSRPHIACVEKWNEENLALASFDGSIKILNLETKKLTSCYHEHVGRAWSVIAFPEEHLLISGADDHSIKLWDAREEKSVQTLSDFNGRVSALLKINPTTFITGSCPDTPYESKEKAEINFWELRKISS